MPESEQKLDLDEPRDRARHIYENMPFSIKREVLGQFTEMSEGGDGGSSGSYEEGEPSIREKYYSHKTDDWFSAVLSSYEDLQHSDEEGQYGK
ncbi:MAG TPA: hypothetical protein EYQ00_10890 [Dehalococcoidia bacterium]|nr:hypothetical protein [Dehalococcoidia bacterium]